MCPWPETLSGSDRRLGSSQDGGWPLAYFRSQARAERLRRDQLTEILLQRLETECSNSDYAFVPSARFNDGQWNIWTEVNAPIHNCRGRRNGRMIIR